MPWEMAAGQVLDLLAAIRFPVSPEFQVLSPSPVSLLKTHHFLSLSEADTQLEKRRETYVRSPFPVKIGGPVSCSP